MTVTQHPEGTLVRLSRDLTEQEREWFGTRYANEGVEFVVEEFLAVADNPEPEPDDIPVDFYYGSVNGGMNNVTAPADAVELVKTAKQMDARRIPTATRIRNELVGELLGSFDTFETDETNLTGERAVEVYGRTYDGLVFGFTVTVSNVYQGDA